MLKIAIFSLVVVIAFCKEDWYKDRNALILTKRTISAVLLKPNEIKIITFLTPECLDCQGMTSVFDMYARDLHKHGRLDISFYQVNCKEEYQLCQEMTVTTYPFIFIFNPAGMAQQEYAGGIYNHQETLNLVRSTIHKIDQGKYLKEQQLNLLRTQSNIIRQPLKQSKQVIQPAPDRIAPTLRAQNQEPGQNQKAQETSPVTANYQNLQRIMENKENSIKAMTFNQQINNEAMKTQSTTMSQTIFTQTPEQKSTKSQQDTQKKSHQKLLNNIKRSRQKKNSFLFLSNGSVLTSMVLVILGVAVGLYLKTILSHSTTINKVIAGDRVYYHTVKQEETQKLFKSVKEIK